MSFRLEKLITKLIRIKEYKIIDDILDYIDIENSGNYFTDLVDIVCICKKEQNNLESFYWFKKRLIDKIYEQRGEEGKNLIKKVME
jgi:hypothetical protein